MLIPQAYAQAAGQPPQGGGLFLPLMMVGILLFMYFTTIRPQRKRQKEHAAMVLEWIRRKDPTMDKYLREFLFKEGPIGHHD